MLTFQLMLVIRVFKGGKEWKRLRRGGGSEDKIIKK